MKIVDQTPFYKENGELSILDRARAILQFGPGWFKAIEAQKSVIAVLKKTSIKITPCFATLSPLAWSQDSAHPGRPHWRLCHDR